MSLAAIRRRWWVVVVCALIGGAGAYWHAHNKAPTYSSTAQVLFGGNSGLLQLFGLPAQVSSLDSSSVAATNQGLASLPIIATRTAQVLGPKTPSSGINVTVSAAGTSDLADVTATANTPAGAVAVANAYSQQLIVYTKNQLQNTVDGAISALQAKINAARTQPALAATIAPMQTTLAQLEAISAAEPVNVSVVQPAGKVSAVGVKTKQDAVLGAIIGALVGVFAVLLADLLDPRLHSADELTGRRMRVIALDRARGPRGDGRGRSAGRRAFKAVLRRSNRHSDGPRAQSFVVTSSAAPRDARSRHDVTLHLAVSAAVTSDHAAACVVALEPEQFKQKVNLATTQPESGEELSDEPWAEAFWVYHTEVSTAAGQDPRFIDIVIPKDDDYLFSVDDVQLRQMANRLPSLYDYVIFDVPPPDDQTPSDLLATATSTVVIVVRMHRTPRRSVEDLLDTLEPDGGEGEIVLATVPPSGVAVPRLAAREPATVPPSEARRLAATNPTSPQAVHLSVAHGIANGSGSDALTEVKSTDFNSIDGTILRPKRTTALRRWVQ
jgi:capsular polysaccharide biosynthesis protein